MDQSDSNGLGDVEAQHQRKSLSGFQIELYQEGACFIISSMNVRGALAQLRFDCP